MKKSAIRNMRKYVEEDNELDLQVRAHSKSLDKYGRYIEELEKEVAILKKVSHPERDFVTCDCCKKKLKENKENI